MADPRRQEVYVTGSGPVWVPRARLNEISTVISERHNLDAERAVQIAKQLRRAV
jgi:type IV secretory pathway ATPase VirB11/archaellum biosynthesis ATPase